MKRKVLFVCTHNSARSQLAEGLLRSIYGDYYESYSAGTEATKVNPFAIKALEEIGIDASGHRSKTVQEYAKDEFDVVVTVCDHAKETCPFFPNGKKFFHKSFEDPSRVEGSDDKKLEAFRLARKQIREWIETTFAPGKGELKGD